VQTAEIIAQSGFTVRLDLGAIDADSEARSRRVVVDADDAVAVMEEMFEDGEVSLDTLTTSNMLALLDNSVPGDELDPILDFQSCNAAEPEARRRQC
jgi:hypothetical protein